MAESSLAGTAPPPWTELEDHLESVRRSILTEIRNYPSPIAACDQQFNHLLEQRTLIARELSRLNSIRDNATRNSDVEAVLDFITESPFIADELKARLAQQLCQRATSPTG